MAKINWYDEILIEKNLEFRIKNSETRKDGNKEKGRALFATIKEPRDNKVTWYCALVWYYANIKDEERLVENMRLALEMERSGHVYQYFVREPDLDPYRQRPAFKALMEAHAPKEGPAQEKKAEPEPVGATR
jgi:hypothetical protein